MFCFTNILNIFFSFVTCSMHKNPHQNAGNGIKETQFFKIFLGSMLPDPLEVLAPSARVGQIHVFPPKISKPVRLCALAKRLLICYALENNSALLDCSEPFKGLRYYFYCQTETSNQILHDARNIIVNRFLVFFFRFHRFLLF